MIEVYPRLYVGNLDDSFEVLMDDGWCIVHAAKEPYHRQEVGYTDRAAPKDHPEYLIARRDRRLILNLIDAPKIDYIPYEIIRAAVIFIDQSLESGKYTLVHCNRGESRAPTIALLYISSQRPLELPLLLTQFIEVYPYYNPANGMQEFLQKYYDHFRTRAFLDSVAAMEQMNAH